MLFSEDLGHFNPATVTADTHAVADALGPRLEAVACGNEPNLFAGSGLRPAGYSLAQYLPEADTCLDTVHAAVPAVALAGPDLDPQGWLAPYARHERGRLGELTEHYYPLSDCGTHPGTITDLLARTTATHEATTLRTASQDAAAAHAPLRIAEANSASCSGIPAVSNTFAAALWVIDYSLLAAEHGAIGVNFHSALSPACAAYSPLCPTSPGHYTPRPMFYGLLALHLLGTGRLLPLHTVTDQNIAAHAVRAPDGTLHLLVENLGPDHLSTLLATGTDANTAQVSWLSAPAVDATTGATLQGAAVNDDGRFTPGPAPTLPCLDGNCSLQLPPYTAALLTLQPGHSGLEGPGPRTTARSHLRTR